MANYPVKWYSNIFEGAPSILGNTFGQIVGVLDAVLVNGFNIKSVSTITRSGSVATVTIPLGHLYRVGQIVRIDGCDQPEYSGDQRVTSVTSNTFTFDVVGAPVTPATGTISCRTSPLGWSIEFSNGNRRIYRAPEGLRHRLYVDDTVIAGWAVNQRVFAKVAMARDASDIDTLIDMVPRRTDGLPDIPSHGWWFWQYHHIGLSTGWWTDSNVTTPRTWVVVGDSKMFYLLNRYSYVSSPISDRVMYGFGEIISYRPGDTWHTAMLSGNYYSQVWNPTSGFLNNWGPKSATYNESSTLAWGQHLMRNSLGYGGATPFRKGAVSFFGSSNYSDHISGNDTGISFPNIASYSLPLSKSYVVELGPQNCLRGELPGLYYIGANVSSSIADLSILTDVAGLPGREFLVVQCEGFRSNNMLESRVAFDISQLGWR